MLRKPELSSAAVRICVFLQGHSRKPLVKCLNSYYASENRKYQFEYTYSGLKIVKGFIFWLNGLI